jgi:uncharacterized membrane protein YuzA (DUF378 family)
LAALNWGLVAVGRVDLVAAIFGMRFGEPSPLGLIVYAVIGMAGIYWVVTWKTIQPLEPHPGADGKFLS